MKAVAMLLILFLPVHTFARIEIDITASDDKSEQALNISGSNEDIISDQERETFNLSDDNLKDAVNAHFGAKPDDAFLRSPTPWGDLYITNDWKQVSRILKPLKAKVLSVKYQPYLVFSEVFNNTSSKSASYKAQIWQNVEDTISSTWQRSGEISATQDIKYGFDIKAMAVSGKADFSYYSRWGENVMKSQRVTVGSETGLEITLQPNQSVTALLYATKGSMQVQVNYEASLYGSVAVNYAELYKGHHFWSIDVNKVLDAGGLNRTVPSSEVIDFGFYVNSYVDVRDTNTNEVVSSWRLNVL